MHQIAPKLWVGSQADFQGLDQYGTEWAVLFVAKEPFHRQMAGYTTAKAPEGPTKFAVRDGNRLALNMIDAPDPKFFKRNMVDMGIAFLDEQLDRLRTTTTQEQVIIVCNQGQSRSPSMGMLYMAPELPAEFEAAEAAYRKICPQYAPNNGIREYARTHWRDYHGRYAVPDDVTAAKPPQDTTQCPCCGALLQITLQVAKSG